MAHLVISIVSEATTIESGACKVWLLKIELTISAVWLNQLPFKKLQVVARNSQSKCKTDSFQVSKVLEMQSSPWVRQRHRQRQRTHSQKAHRGRPSGNQRGNLGRNQLRLLALSLLALSVWYLTPISDFVVDLMLLQVPIQADIELGQRARAEFPYATIHHDKWTPLVRSVGWELVSLAPSVDSNAKRYQWDFGVIDHGSVVNAFALPGGVVRVTLSLLEKLDLTEGELAALLGHEMGHVLLRHSQARVLQRQVLSMVAKALTYEDNDTHEETFGEAIGELLLHSADWVGQQAFSRKDEYEADAVGWDLLADSNRYNPQALRSVLMKLWNLQGRMGGKTSWESTHPGTLDRIDALDKKWNDLTYQTRRQLTRNTID